MGSSVNVETSRPFPSPHPAGLMSLAVAAFNVMHGPYNAKGDSLSDDTAKIQRAINDAAAQGGGVVYLPDAWYRVTNLRVTASNVQIKCAPNARVQTLAAGQNGLDVIGTLFARTTLAVDGALGATAIQVGSTANLVAGDYVLIQSDARITSATLPHLVEINRVQSITDGTHLVLGRPLRNLYPFVGVVHVDKMTAVVNSGVDGGQWVQTTGASGDCIRFTYTVDCYGINGQTTNFGDFGLYSFFTQGNRFRDWQSSAGSDATGGWCFAMHCSQDFTITTCQARDHVWDGFDIAGGSMYGTVVGCTSMNMGDASYNCGHGQRCHHNKFIGCSAIDASPGFNIGSPAYAGDDDNELIGCNTLGGASGVNVYLDSARNKVIGGKFYGATINPILWVNSTTAVDNEFIDVDCAFGAGNGLFAGSRTKVRGGKFRNNNGNGIQFDGAAASDSEARGIEAHNNTGNGIQATNAAAGIIVECPTTYANGQYGVNMLTARSRVVGGIVSPQSKAADTNGPLNWSVPTISGTTPTITALGDCLACSNGGATTMTKLLGGYPGQRVTVHLDANTTVQHNGPPAGGQIALRAAANLGPGVNLSVSLVNVAGNWYEG